jgi:hypothetical protein
LSTSTTTPKPSRFVQVCGTDLCLNGQPFVIKGATAFEQYGDPTAEVALAKQSGLNTLELVEFDSKYHILSDVESSATWDRVDAFIAAAGKAGLHVILSLSEYGQSLAAAGRTPTTVDWGQYLSFIAHRVNTVSGATYATDPTIAMVELFDEIPAPAFGDDNPGTKAEMRSFFSRTLAEWHALSPILVSSGGFGDLNDPSSGIPWQAVMSDPNDATCDIEINSEPDRDVTTPMVTNYCLGLGKPWFLSAWSSCLNSSQYPGDLSDWSTDAEMAAHAAQMYSIAVGAQIAAYAAVGTDFWNLRHDAREAIGSCDIGPQAPITWSVVQSSGGTSTTVPRRDR